MKIYYDLILNDESGIIEEILLMDQKGIIGIYERPLRLKFHDFYKLVDSINKLSSYSEEIGKNYIKYVNNIITEKKYKENVNEIRERYNISNKIRNV